jgi:hypothetical protein
LSEGRAGKVQGGDRLPWVDVEGVDNYRPLRAMDWQIHVYGEAAADLRAWCETRTLPLHTFAWQPEYEKAGLARDAFYLLRPDTYVALASPGQSPEIAARYFSARGVRR